jgi:aminoglycoside N3'-acetyltransferase
MIVSDFDSIVTHLTHDLELKADDVVFLFSGIRGLGFLDGGVETLHNAFCSVLSKGVLILPTFTYSLGNAEMFHRFSPCSEMGALSNFSVKHPAYHRTDNPNFSVSICGGKDQGQVIESLLDVGLDCFGVGSIFDKIYHLGKSRRCYVLLFGGAFDDVRYRSTFIHFAQQRKGVAHRYLKPFYEKNKNRYVTQFVRYLDEGEYFRVNPGRDCGFVFPIEEDFSTYGQDLERHKLLKSVNFAYSESRMVDVRDSVDFFMNKLQQDQYYCIDKRCIKNDEVVDNK